VISNAVAVLQGGSIGV